MNRERELLQRALGALLDDSDMSAIDLVKLYADIRAELEKPETVECGWVDVRTDVFLNGWKLDDIEDGKYRLLAEKITDDE